MVEVEDLAIAGIIIMVVAIAALCGYTVLYDWGLNTGTGQQIGYVSEVMNDGWLWQPTQITLLSTVPTYSEKDTSWDYAPANDQITETAKSAMDSRSKVIVHYTTRFSVARWQFSNRVIITGISILEDE